MFASALRPIAHSLADATWEPAQARRPPRDGSAMHRQPLAAPRPRRRQESMDPLWKHRSPRPDREGERSDPTPQKPRCPWDKCHSQCRSQRASAGSKPPGREVTCMPSSRQANMQRRYRAQELGPIAQAGHGLRVSTDKLDQSGQTLPRRFPRDAACITGTIVDLAAAPDGAVIACLAYEDEP